MGSKNKKQKKSENGGSKRADGGSDVSAPENGRRIITDPRFAAVHSDPRFQKVRKRETKVAIDSRFRRVFTDKRFASSSAPMDKRGKQRKGKGSKDSLREYYRIEDEDEAEAEEKQREVEGSEGEDSEREELVKSGDKTASSEEEQSDKDEVSEEEEEENEGEGEEEGEEGSEVESSTDDDTEEEDEVVYEDGRPELAEENIPAIEQETRRLAIVNMDWRHVSATDLYVMLSSFLPKDGQILSVAVYPSEFGLQRMKEEELHGPVGLFDDGNKNKDEDDEEDEEIINQKMRAYEISRLRYYFGVVECDTNATADYLYKACDGVEFERSSNKLDLRFIPDSMEFKHPPRDVATEAPPNYEGVDFHSQALQMSKVHLTWDEDEPHRVKTLNRKFKAEQLAELELKEFLASDESESDDENDGKEVDGDKMENKKNKYRALIQSGNGGSDGDEKEDDQDMEVTFNTGLEDLSKRILEKKDKKSETVWEAYLKKRREKKRAKKNKSKHSSDDDASSDSDQEVREQPDDFFVEEPLVKRRKEEKNRDMGKEDEASRGELELLLADDNGADKGLKGYNLKREKAKGKRGKEDVDEEKIPSAAFDDPRFSAVFNSPQFALDPTDPHFKRSAAYARQVAQKLRKGDQEEHLLSDPANVKLNSDNSESKDEKEKSDKLSASKKEKHELSSLVRSIKMKSQQAQPSSNQLIKKNKQKHAKAAEKKGKDNLSSLVQSIKKRTKTEPK